MEFDQSKVFYDIISQMTKQRDSLSWILLNYAELNNHSRLKIVASGKIFRDLFPYLDSDALYGFINIPNADNERILFEWFGVSDPPQAACNNSIRTLNTLIDNVHIDQKVCVHSKQQLEAIISREYLSSFFYTSNDSGETRKKMYKYISNIKAKSIGMTSSLFPVIPEIKTHIYVQPLSIQHELRTRNIGNLEWNTKSNVNRQIEIQNIEQAQLLPENNIKIIVIGESGVGKTYMTRTYIHGKCAQKEPSQTVGAEVSTKIAITNGYKLKLEIWDTMGQEKYGALVKTWFRFARGAIIMYDITELDSYEMVSKQWVEHVLTYCDPDVVVMLVGNKTDLENDRQVSYERASNYATARNFLFNETCSFNAHSCMRVFEMLAYEMTKVFASDLENLNKTSSEKEVIKFNNHCNFNSNLNKSQASRGRC